MYLGIPITRWGDPAWDQLGLLPTDDAWVKADPWSAFLPLFRDSDVVVVCSAGNTQDPEPASDDSNPRRNAKPGRAGETSLIVVGGTDPNGLIWADLDGSGTNRFFSIISIFAPGSFMSVARKGGGFVDDKGTSLSAGIVSGLVATFLDRADLAGRFRPGSVASDMKAFLRDVVAPYHTDLKTGAMPRIGTYNYVPCPVDNNGLVKRVGTPIRRPPNAAATDGVSTYLPTYHLSASRSLTLPPFPLPGCLHRAAAKAESRAERAVVLHELLSGRRRHAMDQRAAHGRHARRVRDILRRLEWQRRRLVRCCSRVSASSVWLTPSLED